MFWLGCVVPCRGNIQFGHVTVGGDKVEGMIGEDEMRF